MRGGPDGDRIQGQAGRQALAEARAATPGMELVPGILNTWLSPLIVIALTWVVAVLSFIAWRRGDRSVVGQVILILSLAGGTLLALEVVLEAIAGR